MPAPGKSNPAYQKILTFVSPDVQDILIVETRTATLGQNFQYGDPHPDGNNYPNHVLVLVAPNPDNKDEQRWYWAAKRETQDTYNWEVSYPYAGMPDYPRITRTYIERRDEYTPLDKGEEDPLADPLDAENTFNGAKLVFEEQKRTGDQQFDSLFVAVQRVYDNVPSVPQQENYNWELTYPYHDQREFPRIVRKYVVPRFEVITLERGTSDPVFVGAKLISERVDRFSDVLADSLYLLVTRVYDTIPKLPDDLVTLTGFGYSVDRPHGTDAALRVVWRYPLERSLYSPTADKTACPIEGYESLVLIDEDMQDDPNSAIGVIITQIYDLLPGPSLETVTREKNAGIPKEFISESTVTESQVRQSGGGIPDAPSGLPTDVNGALLSSGVGPDGSSIVVDIKRNVVTKVTANQLSGWEFDPDSGYLLPYTREIVAAGAAGLALQADGSYAEVQPINPYFSIKTTRKATGLVNSANYQRVINYTWPAVLIELDFDLVNAKDQATGESYTLKARYNTIIKEAYSGPCLANVLEYWSSTPATLTAPDQMQPRGIEWDLIFSKGSVEPTLHGAIAIQETVGTDHPIYELQSHTINFPATNFTDWPATLLVDVNQTRYRGGYRVTQVTVLKPT